MIQRFSVGTRFTLNEVEYEVRQQLPASKLNVVRLSTGEFETVTMENLARASARGELKFASSHQAKSPPLPVLNLADYPEKSVEIAERRLALITPTLELHGRGCQEAIRSIAEVHQVADDSRGRFRTESVSERSLYRWRRAYLESGRDIRSLIPVQHRKGNRKRHRTNEESEHILRITIEDLRGRNLRRPLDQIWREYKLRVMQENRQRLSSEALPVHSRATVARRIRELDRDGKLLAPRVSRKSKRQRRQLGRMDYPEFPLERVEMDNTQLDIVLVNDDEKRTVLGRPWMTVMLDTATRCVLAWVMTMRTPSYATLMECIHMAIFPKPDMREVFGTKNEWKSYGIPNYLALDNGKDYRTKDLEYAALSLNIEIDYLPPRVPEDKGAVERFFETLQTQLIHTLPGTTFSSPVQRGDYNSNKEAVLTFSMLERQIHLWCLDAYSETLHSGLGAIPAREWERHMAAGYFPRVPDMSSRELTIILGRTKERTIHPSGIQLFKLTYNSLELGPLRNKLESKGHPLKVLVKYDPRDLGEIFVLDPIAKQYLAVKAIDYEYASGLTTWQHNVVLKHRRDHADREDDVALAETYNHIHAMVEEAVQTGSSKTHKQAAGWMGDAGGLRTPRSHDEDGITILDPDGPEDEDEVLIGDEIDDYDIDLDDLYSDGWAFRDSSLDGYQDYGEDEDYD